MWQKRQYFVRGVAKIKKRSRHGGHVHFYAQLCLGPLWRCYFYLFSSFLILSFEKVVIGVGNGVLFLCLWWLPRAWSEKCDYRTNVILIVFFLLRHLLGDSDIAKKWLLFPMFFVWFFRLTTPLVREAQFTSLNSELMAGKGLPPRFSSRGVFFAKV